MVTSGFLPSRDTRTSLYIVGKGREQERKLCEKNTDVYGQTLAGVLMHPLVIAGVCRGKRALLSCR